MVKEANFISLKHGRFSGVIQNISVGGIYMTTKTRLDLDEEQKQKIMAPEGDEAALSFALDWLELVIFGQCANLRKKV